MSGDIRYVLELKPEWVQAAVAKAMTGIPKPTLMRLAAEGKIRSRRMEDDAAKATDNMVRVFKYSDLLEWIETQAVDPVKLATDAGQGAA